MKKARIALLLALCLCWMPAAHATPAQSGFVVERSLWLKPGRSQQFIGLFKRTELARLDALVRDGSVLWYRTSRPLLGTGRDQWDFRITIAWRDAAAAAGQPDFMSPTGAARKGEPALTMEQALLIELVNDYRDTWVQELQAGVDAG